MVDNLRVSREAETRAARLTALAKVSPLLDRFDGPVASFTADGVYSEVAIAISVLNRMLQLGQSEYVRLP